MVKKGYMQKMYLGGGHTPFFQDLGEGGRFFNHGTET